MTSTNATVTMWVRFFKDAGIPQALGKNYAVLFNDHRIQKEILGDLTREILAEMGIKVMGDVIAILKQAKIVSEQLNRENTSKLIDTKPSTPASRMITHTINSKNFSKPAVPEKKLADTPVTKSVFSRLGEDSPVAAQELTGVFRRLGEPVVSSTGSKEELAYVGVLKKDTSTTAETRVTSSTAPASKKRVSVMERLGPAKKAKGAEEEADVDKAPQRKTVVLKVVNPKVASVKRRVGKRKVQTATNASENGEGEVTQEVKPKTVIVKVRASSLTDSVLPKKEIVIVKKVRPAPSSTRRLKRQSVLDRLGNKITSTASSPTAKSTSGPRVKLNRKSLETSSITKSVDAKPKMSSRLRLRAPLGTKQQPIMSNLVSSTTSAGIFKGEAAALSSVFDRLGRK